MAEKTTNLQLIKPAAGATNWGAAINKDMDILDDLYGGLQAEVKNLYTWFGSVSPINFIRGSEFVNLNDGGTNGILTVGGISEEYAFQTTNQYTDLSLIPDYTGFYVFRTYSGGGSTYPFNSKWNCGDILVKTSSLVNQVRTVVISKWPQPYGGYYVPTTNYSTSNGTSVITLNKIPGVGAPDTRTVEFGPFVVNTAWSQWIINSTNFELVDTNIYKTINPIGLIASSTRLSTCPNFGIEFYKVNTYNDGTSSAGRGFIDTRNERVEVNYWLYADEYEVTDQDDQVSSAAYHYAVYVYIELDPSIEFSSLSSSSSSGTNYVMRYIEYQTIASS